MSCRGEVNPHDGIEMAIMNPPAWVLESTSASSEPEYTEPEYTEETKVEERFI